MTFLATLANSALAIGQTITPDVSGIIRDQVNRAAESQNADRAARKAVPLEILPNSEKALGPFPVESPCWTIRQVIVDGALRKELKWIGTRARSS